MSTTMGWMCRMLGYQSYSSYSRYYNYEWQQNYPIRYAYLECAGSVVPQCRYQAAYNVNYYPNSLWLICNNRNQLGDSTSFYLVDKDMQHTQKGHGILMYNGGTVSGNKFDDTTAELVCRIMGYNNFMSWSTGKRYQFQDSLSVTLNDLNCLESEKVFPLCVYGEDTSKETHENDIWLWCALPTYNNFRLVCPPGQKLVSSNTCVQCTAGTYSPDPSESSSCLSCPANSTSLAGSTFCSCDEGTFMNSTADQCLACPEKSTSKKGSTFCSCVAGTYLYTSGEEISCVQCPGGKISKEGSTAPADCVDCPSGTAPINNGQACSCDEGYGWEWSNDGEEEIGYCKPCLANFYKSKTNGTCAACPKLATSTPLSGECQCPSGLSWDGKSCMNCQDIDNGGVCECVAGTFWNEEMSSCNICPRNHFSGNFSTKCTKCPLNTVSAPQSAECTSCPMGYSWRDYTCQKCPENHVGNGITCSVCPEGLAPLTSHTCGCQNGYGWDWTTDKDGSCKACPANFYKDKDQGTCMKCPHEATSLPLSQDCMCPDGLSWDGSGCVDCASSNSKAGVCDCLPGTFWSEELGQCEPCPPNHFSGKFSTVCKICPVFTVSDSESAECTSCPKGFSWENYTCTERPDNHVGNGATCSVCPEGTSPSKDKTICQKPAVDLLSTVSLVLNLFVIIAVAGIIYVTWRGRRTSPHLEDERLTYQAGSSTISSKGTMQGRRRMS